MLEGLYTYIAQYRDLGDKIFLVIELNEKITSDTVIEIFANVYLTEDMNKRHRDTGLVPNQQRRSHPIYGIYTSGTLQVSAGCYV